MNPRQEIERLAEQIRYHDHLYYTLGTNEISDEEYDKLFARLKEIESAHPHLVTADSPTQRVGGVPLEGFAHVTHAVPMMSIDNTYNETELREFDARVAKGLGGDAYSYIVEPKVDGVSASLRYENGLLVQAATRGDGRVGDDVTTNMRTLRSVPLRLKHFPSRDRKGAGGADGEIPRVIEIRGEVYWPLKEFNRFNEKRVKAGEETFANPRNATTGTLKLLDTKEVATRGLAFVAHGVGQMEPAVAENGAEFYEKLAAWGVPVNPHRRVCRNVDEVDAFIKQWESRRASLPYQTDGLVVKVNDFHQRDLLGTTSRFPRWCIAYKYAAEQAESVVLDIELLIGKLGTLSPRAKL